MRVHAGIAVAVMLLLASCSSGYSGVAWAGDLEEVPEPQRPALTDGLVDLDEYQAAVTGWVACVEEAGVQVVDVELDPSNLYSISTAQGQLSDDELDAIVESCEAAQVSVVEEQWKHQLDEGVVPAALNDYWTSVRACLRRQGVDVGADITPDAFYAAMRSDGAAYQLCTEEAGADVPGVAVRP